MNGTVPHCASQRGLPLSQPVWQASTHACRRGKPHSVIACVCIAAACKYGVHLRSSCPNTDPKLGRDMNRCSAAWLTHCNTASLTLNDMMWCTQLQAGGCTCKPVKTGTCKRGSLHGSQPTRGVLRVKKVGHQTTVPVPDTRRKRARDCSSRCERLWLRSMLPCHRHACRQHDASVLAAQSSPARLVGVYEQLLGRTCDTTPSTLPTA